MEVPGRIDENQDEVDGAVSEEASPLCRICERNDQINDADVFCLECWEHFCNNCGRVHRATLQSRHHQQLDKSHMPRKAFKARHMCESHPGTMLEYFCTERDQLLCRHCVTLNHQGCHGDDLISNICNRPEDGDLTEIYNDLQETQQSIHQEQSEMKYNMEAIKMNKIESKKDIDSFKKELHTFVDRLVDNMYTEMNNCVDTDQEIMSKVNKESNTVLAEVQDLLTEVDFKIKSKDKVQLFIAKKTAEKARNIFKYSLESIRVQNCIRKFCFEPEKQLQDMMRSVQKLGQLSVEVGVDIESDSDECVVEGSARNLGQLSVDEGASVDAMPIGRALVHSPSGIERTVATKTEEILSIVKDSDVDANGPWVTGIETLDNDLLVACDYLTKCVNVVALRQKKAIHSVKLRHQPWDLTKITKTRVAVTCPDGRYLQLVEVSWSVFKGTVLSLDRQIRVQGRCSGIQYIGARGGGGGDKMVVTFDTEAKVQIIDLSGTVLKDLSTDSTGHALFREPQYVAVSPYGPCIIYISDSVNSSITGMGLDGKVRFTYVDDQLQTPKGMAVGHDGVIYVCSKYTDEVQMVSSTGRKIKALIKGEYGVRYPFGIACNSTDSKLYVGMYGNAYILSFTLWSR